MREARLILLLGAALLACRQASALDVQGNVLRNGGTCAADGICSFDVQVRSGSVDRFIWGWEAQRDGCDADIAAIRAASKLATGQIVHVHVPDGISGGAGRIYYLCEGSRVQGYASPQLLQSPLATALPPLVPSGEPPVEAKPSGPLPLEHTLWRILAYDDGQALRQTSVRGQITFAEGMLKGSAGCGGMVSHYVLEGDHITIKASPLKESCSPTAEAENDIVLKSLAASVRYEQRADQMLFYDDLGAVEIVLGRAGHMKTAKKNGPDKPARKSNREAIAREPEALPDDRALHPDDSGAEPELQSIIVK